ncbi:uncharacterized protein LOC111367768 isoform X2 [Olea europaea var. sylvestris]|uniref:uncharacterized protein LOC111367768 isoform X2 n=1 Tax=Olea europaea var. sylvestris TaxID=158386 RepID=UPI000C1D58CB|nr:uncharacterized protein LOC111367768 isoform X2 [Olea europaea var. sylvestris]
METRQISKLLIQTLSPDSSILSSATDALDHLSRTFLNFPFSLLSIIASGDDQGVKLAAATYLKNFTRRNTDANCTNSSTSKEFRDQLMRALLQVEPPVLKVLIEAFRAIVAVEFVKSNAWPELVPELRWVIEDSDRICNSGKSKWKTINALTVLHSLIRPFQYFLNPKLVKEPVPPQLELITKELLVPLLAVFHHQVEKASTVQGRVDEETEKILLITCKCIYFTVRSHMPSALAPFLPSLCSDLFKILSSITLEGGEAFVEGQTLRRKTGKRGLLIFCALVTRHRKFSDKLMPDILDSVSKIVKYSSIISGWRLVSSHFSTLLDSAIFPTLIMNEKDIAEWEEDAEEYMRKNLPSELEEISGWREDLFTARKSSLNLLGIISISKGPPVLASSVSSKRKKGERNKRKDCSSIGELLVLPYLSKFPIPVNSSSKAINEYFGVLMAYSSLLDFLKEQKPGFIATLIRTRVLPLYKESLCQPYLIASANWVLGELSPCIPEEMNADIYASLLKVLTMPDTDKFSCFPVRTSSAGAIAKLVENDYMPPEWLPLLQMVVGRISDDEEDTSVYLQLLGTLVEIGSENVAPYIPDIVPLLVRAISRCIPPSPDPWPQMVERGFATLALVAQCWEDSAPEGSEENESYVAWVSRRTTIAKAFSDLLQRAWFKPFQSMDGEAALSKMSPSCVDDSSTLLGFIIQYIADSNIVLQLKISELLVAWSNLIADWNAWEEMEDLSIFKCIKEAVSLNNKFALKNFVVGQLPSPPAPPVPQRSIIEGIGLFVTEAFSQYPSAVWRASSCVHMLLHVTSYSLEQDVKKSLAFSFSKAAFSRFRETKSKPCSLWKPLLLGISSCYLHFPDGVEKILETLEHEGFTVWVSALAFILTDKFEHKMSTESEIKLTGMTLVKVIERLLTEGKQRSTSLHDCFTSLIEASIRAKEMQVEEEEEDEEDEGEDDNDEDSEDDDEEDSEDDEIEETEEEFLERCAKVATALENGTIVEEGDLEDQEQDIDLGTMEEVDLQSSVLSLIQRYHGILVQGQSIPPHLISSFISAFPECNMCFQQIRH